MTDALQSDMLEATRLTGAGRLIEATALLQRMLQGKAAPSGASPPAGSERPTIEGVAESGKREDPASHRVRPKFSASVSRLPASAPGTPQTLVPAALRGFLDQASRGEFPLPSGSSFPPPTEAPAALPEGAQFLAGTFSNHAGSRPYKLYVPSGYRPDRPVPLVVMLHGCTQSPDDFAAGTRMNEAAEEHTCLVVYPGQTVSANRQKCWNWFSEGDQHRSKGEPALIAGITRLAMRDYAVDPRCVYVAGLSAGGAAAAIMGEAYPDLYAALGVHSGLACGAANDMPSALAAMQRGSSSAHGTARGSLPSGARRVVRTIVFHGDRDSTVNPRNGDAVAAQAAQAEALTEETEDGQVPGGHAYKRTRRAEVDGRMVVEQWVVHGAGHAWFGGSPAGSYTDPRGPNATREMLRFFLEHPHPAPGT